MVYRQRRDFRGRATVCVEGLHDVQVQPGGGGGEWVELGCQDVALGGDKDTIRVGRREGRFRAIRLSARGNDVEMVRLTVVYGSGTPDDIDVRRMVRQGDRTGPLDLKGRDRAIDRIELTYRRRLNFRGRATLCVEGLAA
ncbi:MAG: hypothetical protein ACREC6_03110 [Hyphomicrobiaceae bacterium]